MNNDTILNINITELIPNEKQPRKIFDEKSLIDLSTSIKEYGIINPILVTKEDDKYKIIAGERRYRAAKLAGLEKVPVIIKDVNNKEILELALIENLHRENLNPIEEAKSYEDILKNSNITQQELGKKIGKSQSFIANKIRLLSLPKSIRIALAKKQISERHARSLMRVEKEEEQENLLKRIINEKITVKELDEIISNNEITGENLKAAIDEIIKSLNMKEEDNKKEEKESDKMNNGNFFPNYNNQNGGQENTTLNEMNIQTTPPTPMAQETVMPTAPIAPEPTLGEQTMTPPPIEDNSTPQMMDPPLFNQSSAPLESQPVPAPMPEMVAPAPLPTFEEPSVAPTPEVVMPSAPNFEIPINNPVNQESNNASKIKEFLNSNGIQYKSYSNETNECIIIEL